jgi:ferritin-like metal-binding protein YciE
MTQQQALLSWLKDAHAMEVGALPTLRGHAAAAQKYPELHAKLLAHAEASARHAEKLEGCIERLGGHPSALKEAVGAVMGKVGGVANLPAKDTVIKNTLGDFAAENFEIASYRSLIAAAEKLGDQETARVCKEILRDEEEMASFLAEHIPTFTQNFLDDSTGEEDDAWYSSLESAKHKAAELGSHVDQRSALLALGLLFAGIGTLLIINHASQD